MSERAEPITEGDAWSHLRQRRMITLNRRMEIEPDRISMVTQQLRDRGFEVEQRGDSPGPLTREDVVWVWGNAAWFPKTMRAIEELPAERRPATVIWHVEPLPLPKGHGWPRPTMREVAKVVRRDPRASDVYTNYWTIRRLVRAGLPSLLAVSSVDREVFLAERGIPSVRVPYGYELSDGRDLGIERDIDVLLLGVLNLRSRKRAVRLLRKAGIAVETRGDYKDPALWGENRTKLVNRAKTMLSIGRFPGTLASKRFFITMACNSLLVSDPLYDGTPFVPNEHYIESPVDELPELIGHYLEHESDRARLAQQGHDFVTKEATMERSFDTILTLAAERID